MSLPVSTINGWNYHAALRAILFGIVIALLLIGADRVSALGIGPAGRFVDNLCGGLIGGLLVYWYERRRSQQLRQKLQIIAEMNHHVRNALQVIKYSQYIQSGDQMQQVLAAVDRIDWALREVLPGEDAALRENAGQMSPRT